MPVALCHHYDVIRSRDVIDHMTVRLGIDDFLYVLNRNQTRVLLSLSFHDVIANVITPGMWTLWSHITGDDYVKRSSNSLQEV